MKKDKSRVQNLTLLLVAIDALGLGIILPVFPFYLMHVGGSFEIVTQSYAIYCLAAFLAAPCFGALSDWLGRKRIILFSLFLGAAAYFGMLIAASPLILLLFRGLTGFSAGNESVLTALLVDYCENDEEEAHAISKMGGVRGVGMLVGPFVGAIISAISGGGLVAYYNVIMVASCVFLLAAVLAIIWLPNDRTTKSEDRLNNYFIPINRSFIEKIRASGDIIGINMTLAIGVAVMFSTTAIYVEEKFGWGPSETGILLASMVAIVAITRVKFAAPIILRFGNHRTLVASILLFSLGSLVAAIAPNPFYFCLGYIAINIGFGLAPICITLLFSAQAVADDRGLLLSFQTSSFAFGQVLAAVTTGYIFANFGPGMPFLIASAVMLTGAAIFSLFHRRQTATIV